MKNHKKTFARRLRTREEIKKGIPLFDSKAWLERKQARANKVANRIAKAEARKIERLAKLEVEQVPAKKKKLTPGELRQIRRKVKRIKFVNKIKNLI